MVKILYVEDDEINGVVMQGLLKKFGVEVLVARTVNEARKYVADEAFPLILMDIQLGDEVVDGVMLAKEIKQMEPYQHCPIFAVTADADSGASAYFLSEGFERYFAKPFDRNQLWSAIEEILNRK